MSLLGGIMLIGIVVKNGIVLIDYITLCRERGMAVIHSVVTAGRSRLRPVLMTTLTTILVASVGRFRNRWSDCINGVDIDFSSCAVLFICRYRH